MEKSTSMSQTQMDLILRISSMTMAKKFVAFDTQFTPEIARKSIAYLRTQTSHPITYAVITHPNPDKFNGLAEFKKIGAKIISSKATSENLTGVHEYKKYFFVKIAKMFTEENYPHLGSIDIKFDKNYDLRLANGEKIQLFELAQSGVSTNQTIAYIPSQATIMVGDLIHNNAHAWLEGGIVNGKATPTLKSWISCLLELQSLFKDKPDAIVYGGRGNSSSIEKATHTQIQYLQTADSIVSKYIQKLGSRKIELQNEKANEHYQALQTLFEKEFPTYNLGYMIQYGIYGFVNSKL